MDSAISESRPRSRAVVATPAGARYLGQLCKHFGHKIPVTQDGATGRMEFPFGTCTGEAVQDALALTVEAPDAEALTRLQGVIDSHLRRFAFRESLEIAWQAA